jgi:hypothetical protein
MSDLGRNAHLLLTEAQIYSHHDAANC